MGELDELVRDYGPWIYALLFAYTALKSGYLPVIAGYFASLGDLDVALVAMSAFLGAWLGDEARFWIAHRYADRIRAMPRLARSIRVAVTVGIGYLAGDAAVAAIGERAGSIGVGILVLMLAGSAIVVSLAARNATSSAQQPAAPPP